ncbi:MAG TPA: SDR family oxidoreductase [Cytophagales bacterium]|nr:SDR family oxidoreductase [Cytophagales bacterium]
MNILLTGATGIIGREVLTELLLYIIHNQLGHKIICMARGSSFFPAHRRIQELVSTFCSTHQFNESEISKYIQVIDIGNDVPRSYSSLIMFLKKSEIKDLRVIHLASTVNISTMASSEEDIYTQSYLSTMDLLERLAPYIRQFSFTSTAFSCGHQHGIIPSEYNKLDIKANRNYYERFKLEAERRIKHICDAKGITWQILRPSIVCGKLLNKPYYFTPKFNMFYEWVRFFYDLNSVGINLKGFRIKANPLSSINIISSDYVSKAIVKAFYVAEVMELNIVHSKSLEMPRFISGIMNSVATKDFEIVDDKPELPTVAEKLYYDTIGNQASPYLHTPQHQFETSRLRTLMADIPEPDIAAQFENMLSYAIAREFKEEVL